MSASLRPWTEFCSDAKTGASIAWSNKSGDSVFSISGGELQATVEPSVPTGFRFDEVIEVSSVALP
jgi:hypothetical protein